MNIAGTSLPRGNLMTYAEKTHDRYHRYHFIIHTAEGMFHIARFHTEEQLQAFARQLGFSYFLMEETVHPELGIYRKYRLDRQICNSEKRCFTSWADIPNKAKPIKALSNGSIVDCFYVNDGNTITFYRPNPNIKEIYNPMTTPEHIAYQRDHGIY